MTFASLRESQDGIWVAPSILAADCARFGEEVEDVLEAGADLIHFDVMDNHFVPNLSFGPMILKSLRKRGIQATMDVHLMVEPVESLIRDFAAAGADNITIHAEADNHLDRAVSLIRDLGCTAGLAFNPTTPIGYLDYLYEKLDLILIMTINPGFGGQKLMPITLEKVAQVRRFIDEKKPDIRLQVDGGIKTNNIAEVARAGADTFVAGTAIFGQEDYSVVITQMREECAS